MAFQLDHKLVDCDVITIEVGEPPKIFKVHEKLLRARGGFFFKGALNGHFKESETRCVPLRDVDPDLFLDLVGWLYNGLVPHFIFEDSVLRFDPTEFPGNDIHRLFRLWILGDKLQIPLMQNFILDCIQKALIDDDGFELHLKECLEFIFANTVSSSVLREFAVDAVLLCYPRKDMKEYLEEISDEIARYIAARACWHLQNASTIENFEMTFYGISYDVE